MWNRLLNNKNINFYRVDFGTIQKTIYISDYLNRLNLFSENYLLFRLKFRRLKKTPIKTVHNRITHQWSNVPQSEFCPMRAKDTMFLMWLLDCSCFWQVVDILEMFLNPTMVQRSSPPNRRQGKQTGEVVNCLYFGSY